MEIIGNKFIGISEKQLSITKCRRLESLVVNNHIYIF